ncbi:MAG: hypothetical protein N2314_08130, partial [Brevinematales bacterium]|nr:hypothetical protein [Brevinematales bacterium]
ISYVLVVKESMDSFSPRTSWPTFSIPCEGIYIYSNGIITYIRENYNPRKYLKKDDTLVLIKLEEQK